MQHTEFIWKTKTHDLPGAMCLNENADCCDEFQITAGVKQGYHSDKFYPCFQIEHVCNDDSTGKDPLTGDQAFDLGHAALETIRQVMNEADIQVRIARAWNKDDKPFCECPSLTVYKDGDYALPKSGRSTHNEQPPMRKIADDADAIECCCIGCRKIRKSALPDLGLDNQLNIDSLLEDRKELLNG